MNTLGIILQDFVKKTNIRKAYKQLLISQYWDTVKVENYKTAKLKELVNYAYNNVPYYTDLLNSIRLKPSDIIELRDIKKIPILTKEAIIKNQHKLVSKNLNPKLIKKGKTGGTTGVPLTYYKDIYDRSITWGSYYRWYEWMGIRKSDKILTLWGSISNDNNSFFYNVRNYIIESLSNGKTIDSYKLTESNINELYDSYINFNPSLLKGYVSSLEILAIYMRQNNLSVNSKLKAISTTAEVLTPNTRTLLSETFNVPIYDQYGCGEISSIAYECAFHTGLHVTEEHVIVESLNEQGQDVFNETGKLIITSLDNFVMPFIRYENGDMGILSNEKCGCGVNSSMIKSIAGRSVDLIFLKDGRKVRGGYFTSILSKLGITTDVVSRFQISQFDDKSVDFLLESDKIVDASLIKKLNELLKKDIENVSIRIVSHIANESNGKFKYIRNEATSNLQNHTKS